MDAFAALLRRAVDLHYIFIPQAKYLAVIAERCKQRRFGRDIVVKR
jgi:hypothetical protein